MSLLLLLTGVGAQEPPPTQPDDPRGRVAGNTAAPATQAQTAAPVAFSRTAAPRAKGSVE